MIITITNIEDAVEKTKGKGKWSEMEVTYNSDKGEQKKTFRSMSSDWEVGKKLEADKTYDVSLGKDGNFWVWKAAKEVPAGTKAAPKASFGGGGNGYNSEERMALDKAKFEFEKSKQPLIVRQSSLSTAVAYYGIHRDDAPSPEDIIRVANQFEEYVYSQTEMKEMEIE